jgi:D-serine deaminase-like pyridoxal phosphate-dependent protein
MPISSDKLQELNTIKKEMGQAKLRLMVDHASQIEFLDKEGGEWSVFVKVDGGGK